MAQFQETVETIRAEEASVRNLFGGGGERAVRSRRKSPKYMGALAEAATFLGQVLDGKRPLSHLEEALSTDDFPILFSDILDRQLLANYQEWPVDYEYIRQSTVRDFRTAKRYAIDGAEGALDPVGELEEYPQAELQESYDSLSVRKYGKRIDLSWETFINDDLDALRALPQRLAKGARRTEAKFIAQLFVGSAGLNTSLYTNGVNRLTGNPALSMASLQAAMTLLGNMLDEDDEPILIDMVHLVVGPGLDIVANNILNAIQIEMTDTGGSSSQKLIAKNWMANRFKVHVNPYIPRIASSNAATSWFLFADPASGRAALEFAKLRGHENPELYERMSNSRSVSGGGEALEAFEDDSHAYKVRHVMGGTQMVNTGGQKATVASNGSGS